MGPEQPLDLARRGCYDRATDAEVVIQLRGPPPAVGLVVPQRQHQRIARAERSVHLGVG